MPMPAHGGVKQRYSYIPFATSAVEGGGWSAQCAGCLLVPIVQEAGWTSGTGLDGHGKSRLLPLLGFDPRTAQPVASRCIDYAVVIFF
jgi:hypothetical protein